MYSLILGKVDIITILNTLIQEKGMSICAARTFKIMTLIPETVLRSSACFKNLKLILLLHFQIQCILGGGTAAHFAFYLSKSKAFYNIYSFLSFLICFYFNALFSLLYLFQFIILKNSLSLFLVIKCHPKINRYSLSIHLIQFNINEHSANTGYLPGKYNKSCECAT